MRTKNKCIEGGASHKGSRAPKTTLAKGTKGNSSVASSSSKKWKPAKRISGPMATGVFGEEQHRTLEGAKIKVANISPQPWSARIPCWAAENESKLVRIPRGQDSLDLPLPDGVTHVTAEAATELLDLIAGLNAVLFSTAWQASIEIRRLRQENEILKNTSGTTIASSGLVQHLLNDDAEHEFHTKFKYDIGRKGNTKLVIQEEHEEDEEEEEEEEDEDEDEEGDEEEVWIEDGDEDEDEDADEDGAAAKGNPDAEQHSTYQKCKGEKSLRSRTPKRKKTK